MTKEIELSKGFTTIVDDRDYGWIIQHKWHALNHHSGKPRAIRRDGKKRLLLHREIMNAPAGIQVDHINGNPLDNRRCNLRLCTHAENQHNSHLRKDNASGFKGVHWHKATGKWGAQIRVNGKRVHLGLFVTPEEAARAYDKAAHDYHGAFARINLKRK